VHSKLRMKGLCIGRRRSSAAPGTVLNAKLGCLQALLERGFRSDSQIGGTLGAILATPPRFADMPPPLLRWRAVQVTALKGRRWCAEDFFLVTQDRPARG